MSLVFVLENNAVYEGDHIKQTFMKTVHSNSVTAADPQRPHTHTNRGRERMREGKECFVPIDQMLLYKAHLSSERVKSKCCLISSVW